MNSTAAVLLEITDATAWVTLNRPEAMNAMSPALTADLAKAVAAIEQNTRVRVVIITGAGRAFSAGGDLKSFREAVASGRYAEFIAGLRQSQALFRRIEALPCPVIAAVNGAAVAGGLELILCCDLVIAAESARIGDGHAKYGVIPGAGSTARLPRRVPVNVAKMLLLSGELWPARDLIACGLVNQVVPDDALRAAAEDLAARLAANSPLGLKWIKRLVDNGQDQPLEVAAAAELTAFESYARSEDFREGLAAFAEKRRPVFRGI